MVKIFDFNGQLHNNGEPIHVDDDSITSKEILGVEIATLNFSLKTYQRFDIGSYCFIYGERYTLNVLPSVKKVNNYHYKYTLIFESEISKLGRCSYLFYNEQSKLREKTIFDLNGKASDFLNVMVKNLNMAFPYIERVYDKANNTFQEIRKDYFFIGNVKDTEYKTLSFENKNCLQVLNQLSEVFDLEYSVKYGRDENQRINKVIINLNDLQGGNEMILKYGKSFNNYNTEVIKNNNDFNVIGYTIQQQEADNIVNRLYAFGGKTNIPTGYDNGTDRLNLRKINKGKLYVEKIGSVEQYGLYENTIIFDEVYPTFTGVVTEVLEKNKVKVKELYNGVQSNIGFDLSNNGATPKVVFKGNTDTNKTNDLSGYTFDISSFNKDTSILEFNGFDDKIIIIPNETLKPKVGDTFTFVNVIMQQTYIDRAESELLRKANEYLNNNLYPKFKIDIVPNDIWFKYNYVELVLGQSVRFVFNENEKMERLQDIPLKITAFDRSINYKYKYSNIKVENKAKSKIKLLN